jgi:hypothetical protein
MAAQLDKRARQLAERKGRSYEDALAHLLELMRQGAGEVRVSKSEVRDKAEDRNH